MGTWWPKEYSIGHADMADFVVEPMAGGRWSEAGVDGTECNTGRVTVFEPPERLVLAWHLDETFQYDPDRPRQRSRGVRFIAEDLTRPRVELEHRDFQRHGAGAQAVHDSVDQSWCYCLEVYAKQTAAQARRIR